MGCREGDDILEEREWLRKVAEGEPGAELARVGYEGEAAGGEGFHFGGKAEGALGGIVEGLLATTVAGEEEGVGLLIMNREGEHAVELFGERGAPLEPGGGEDFAVALGVEGVAVLFELLSELSPIVDLAIANRGHAAALRTKGLLARGEVENGQAGHPHGEVVLVPDGGVVRASVVEARDHASEGR